MHNRLQDCIEVVSYDDPLIRSLSASTECIQELAWDIGEFRHVMKANVIKGNTDPEHLLQEEENKVRDTQRTNIDTSCLFCALYIFIKIIVFQKEAGHSNWIFQRKKLSEIFHKVEKERRAMVRIQNEKSWKAGARGSSICEDITGNRRFVRKDAKAAEGEIIKYLL